MSNTIFYFKGKFVKFDKKQVNPSDIGEGKKYREVSGDALIRYNECLSAGIRVNPNYVFQGGDITEDEIVTRKQILTQKLQNNFIAAQGAGVTIAGNTYRLDAVTKTAVSDWNQMVEKENRLLDADPNYTRLVTAMQLTDVNGDAQQIAVADWDAFFLTYGAAYGALHTTESVKRNTIQKATTMDELVDSLAVLA